MTNAKLSDIIKPSGCGEGVSICVYTACAKCDFARRTQILSETDRYAAKLVGYTFNFSLAFCQMSLLSFSLMLSCVMLWEAKCWLCTVITGFGLKYFKCAPFFLNLCYSFGPLPFFSESLNRESRNPKLPK